MVSSQKLGRTKTTAVPSEFTALKRKAGQGRKECVYRFGDYRQGLGLINALGSSPLSSDLRAHLLISSPVTILARLSHFNGGKIFFSAPAGSAIRFSSSKALWCRPTGLNGPAWTWYGGRIMFLRYRDRRKNGKPHRDGSVVENRRLDHGKTVQRQVLHLAENPHS